MNRSCMLLCVWTALVAVLAGCDPSHSSAVSDGPPVFSMKKLGNGANGVVCRTTDGVRIDMVDPDTKRTKYAATLTTPDEVLDVRIIDVGSDGKDDIVVVQHDSIGVFEYDATLTPAPYRPYRHLRANLLNPAVDGPRLAVSPMNADLALDLVIARSAAPMSRGPDDSCDVDVYLNDGNGNFTSNPITYTFPLVTGVSKFAVDVFAAKLDGDNTPEIVLFSGNGMYSLRYSGTSLIPIVAATGQDFAGTTANFVSQCRTSVSPFFAVSHDVGADGFMDFYALTGSNLNLYRSQGNRTFAAPQMFAVGTPTVTHLTIGDVDRDEIADFLATRRGSAGLTIFKGTTAGGLIDPHSYYVGENPVGTEILPYDEDEEDYGYPWLAMGLEEGAIVAVAPDAGLYHSPQLVSSVLSRIAAGDINDDGYNDVFGSSGQLSLYLNEGNGSGKIATTPLTYPLPSSGVSGLCYVPKGPVAGARFGVATTNNLVALFRKTGPMSIGLDTPLSFDGRPPAVGIAAADLTGDDNAEVIVVNSSMNDSQIDISTFVFNAGTGLYTTPSLGTNLPLSKIQIASRVSGPNSAGNYHMGLICKSASGLNDTFGIARFAPGAGGTFAISLAKMFSVPTPMIGVTTADFDNDGEPDYIALNFGGTGFTRFLSSGPSDWTMDQFLDWWEFAAGGIDSDRFDADEYPDFAVTRSYGGNRHGRLVTHRNLGNGNFDREPTNFLTGAQPTGVTLFTDLHRKFQFRPSVGGVWSQASVSEEARSGAEAIICYSGFLAVTPGGAMILPNVSNRSSTPSCTGDLNADSMVDDADFVLFLAAYNILDCADPSMPDGCAADFNDDGVVEDGDFQIFVPAYNALVCP